MRFVLKSLEMQTPLLLSMHLMMMIFRSRRIQILSIFAVTALGLILYDAPWIFRLPKRSLENFYGGLSDDQETSLQRVSGEDYKSSGTSFQVDKLDPENYMKDLTDEELLLVSVHVPTCSSTSKKRTSKLEYNRVLPGERYFMYSPSGGFNNQRKELEYGLKISKLLNRT